MIRNKIFFKIVLIIICIFCLLGTISWLITIITNNKENEFVVEKYMNNQYITVNENDLINYFENNYIEADEYYNNQVLLVIGRITSIIAPDNDGFYIILNNYSNRNIIIEYYFTDTNKIGDINNGNIVKIIGRYDSYNNELNNRRRIIIKNCKIIEKIN
jgi:hypothetical protein